MKNASPGAAFMLAFRVGGAVLSVIDINGEGTFGIARGTEWLVPAYQFTSNRLSTHLMERNLAVHRRHYPQPG